MGIATTRPMDRIAAAMGLLEKTDIIFECCDDIPNGVVLGALPALLGIDLLRHAHSHFTIPAGYYPLESICLLLAYLALGRVPEVKTLRETALVHLARETLRRSDDARSFVRGLMHPPINLRPDSGRRRTAHRTPRPSQPRPRRRRHPPLRRTQRHRNPLPRHQSTPQIHPAKVIDSPSRSGCLRLEVSRSVGFLRLKMCSDCLSRWMNPAETAGTHCSLPRSRDAFDDGAQHFIHVLPTDRDFGCELDAVAEHRQSGAFDVLRGDESPAVERGEGFADFH